jgi:hypothetical protein
MMVYLEDARARGMDPVDALDRTIAFNADGRSFFMSIETRTRAVRDNALRQLVETFEATDPKFFGLFENQQGVRDLTAELFGRDSGNALAKKGAEAWHKVAEALRLQFNAAGGEVGKLEGWAIPQHHSQMKVAKAGRDAWADEVLPLLDRTKYTTDTGRLMSGAEVKDFLGHVWETIATGGVNKIEPGVPSGAGHAREPPQ